MSNLHEVLTVRCAHCGQLRQEASRWFVVSAMKGKFLCMPLGKAAGCTGIDSFHRPSRLKSNQQPACGRLCAQRLFERYLAAETSRRPADARNAGSAQEIE